MKRGILGVLSLFLVAVVGCDDGTPVDPAVDWELPPPAAGETGSVLASTEQVCETMDFGEFDGMAGEQVTSISLFDFNVSVTVTPGGSQSLPEARVFDTSRQDLTNDADLQYPPAGICQDCADMGLGNVLIIQQKSGFGGTPSGGDMIPDDSRDGGVISFSGFAGQEGTFTLEEYLAVDDDVGEPSFDAYVDGGAVSVGASNAIGDGTVEAVSTGSAAFTSSFEIEYHSSGAVDDILVCRETEIPGGGQGCTPGYWKQEQHFDAWQDFAPGDSFCDAFGLASPGLCDTELRKPESGTLGDLTLLEALELRGGGINALVRHAVAALLNADNDGISYDLTEAGVIADFIAAVDGGDIDEQKDIFDELNNQGCPCNNQGCPVLD